MTKFNIFGQILGGGLGSTLQLGNVRLSYGSTSPSLEFDNLQYLLSWWS